MLLSLPAAGCLVVVPVVDVLVRVGSLVLLLLLPSCLKPEALAGIFGFWFKFWKDDLSYLLFCNCIYCSDVSTLFKSESLSLILCMAALLVFEIWRSRAYFRLISCTFFTCSGVRLSSACSFSVCLAASCSGLLSIADVSCP